MSGAGGRHSRAAILDGPIGATLLRLTWPMTVTALISSWQGLISMFWIGRMIGTPGLTAIAVLDPVFVILGLISGSAYIGVQVLTARATGSGDGRAIPILINGGYLALAWAGVVMAIGLWQLGPIAHALAGDIDITPGLEAFLRPWFLFYAMPVVSGVTLFAVSATGWTRFGLIQTVMSIVLVMTLMPLFVGALDLGLAGVSISDGISDTLLVVLTCLALYKFRRDLDLGTWRRGDARLDVGLWKQIAGVGLFYQAARAMDFVAQAVMVRIVMESGRDADVAAYGVAFTLIVMPTGALGCIGGAAGIMIGQNHGAGNGPRAKAILRTALIWLAVVGVGLIVLGSFAAPLIRVFTDDPVVVARSLDTIAALRWTLPATMMGSCLLRAYTAISANKFGNSISIACALLGIGISTLLPGEPLTRVMVGLIAGQYTRLALLLLTYRRSFGAVVGVTS